MDIDQTLKNVRSALAAMDRGDDATEELYESVSALDAWISKGGFLPTEWKNAVPKPNRHTIALETHDGIIAMHGLKIAAQEFDKFRGLSFDRGDFAGSIEYNYKVSLMNKMHDSLEKSIFPNH